MKPQVKNFENASKRILGQELAYKAVVNMRAYSFERIENKTPFLVPLNAVAICVVVVLIRIGVHFLIVAVVVLVSHIARVGLGGFMNTMVVVDKR